MKLYFICFSLLFNALAANAQTFDGPESIEYDAANSRWLVANSSGGTVVSYYPQTNSTTTFCSGLTSGPYGIEILGNNLYVCDGARIKGYDLATGTQNFNVNLGATFLNGITSDGSQYLYTTDFSAKKIYRVNTTNSDFNIMASTTKSPNGIYYDGANNRCVFVNWGAAAPIQALSLADSTITTLVTTSLSNCDGITRDNDGNWYVTAWGNSALNRFDSAFTQAPVAVKTGLSSPADIDISAAGDSIGISNSGAANNIVFHTLAINTNISQIQQQSKELKLYPNPATGDFIYLNREDELRPDEFTYYIYSMEGRLLQTGKGMRQIYVRSLPNGSYILKTETIFGRVQHARFVVNYPSMKTD